MRLYRTATETVPANQSSDRRTTLLVEPSILQRVKILVPPGHRGETTIAFDVDGTRIIPFGAGETIVADNEVVGIPSDWPLHGGRITVVTTNADRVAHSFFLRLLLETDRSRARTGQPGPALPRRVADTVDFLAALEPLPDLELPDELADIEEG